MKIEREQIENLKKLSDASGVSGAEGSVRELILEQVKEIADEVSEDALGNVIARKKAKVEGAKKVMFAAHMDEIGFMITADDGDGLYQFECVGGIDVRQLPGKAVYVGKERIPGVIGARAIHLTTSEQRKTAIPLETLRIDVGPQTKVKLGDRAVFATEFWENGVSLFGKALDDRLGVATLIELLKVSPEHLDCYYVFTCQEEIGGRGAQVAAYNIHPDIGIAIDSTPANDYPVSEGENTLYNTRLGHGPAIYTMDRATISDARLIQHFITTAEKYQIPFQLRQAGSGGTDAGVIHQQHEGIPSISISVPSRNVHTAVGIARIMDWENLVELVHAGLKDWVGFKE